VNPQNTTASADSSTEPVILKEEKLALILLFLMVLGLGFYMIYDMMSISHTLLEEHQQRAETLAETMMVGIRTTMLSGQADHVQDLVKGVHERVTTIEKLRIYNQDGQEVYSDVVPSPSHPLNTTPAIQDSVNLLLKTGQPLRFIQKIDGINYLTQLKPLHNATPCQTCHDPAHPVIGVVEVSTSLAPASRRMAQTGVYALSVILAGLILGGIVLRLLYISKQKRTAELQEHNRIVREYATELEVQKDHLAEMVAERTAELQEKLQVIQQQQRELKEHQAQLVENERLATLGEMAGMITHEINNAISGLGAPLHLIKSIPPLDEETIWHCWESDQEGTELKAYLEQWRQQWDTIQEGLNLIELTDKRTRTIVQDVRNLIGGQSRVLRPTNICHVFRETVRLQQRRLEDIRIEENFSAESINIVATSGELGQIFTNFLINAAHALEQVEHPTITVQITQREDKSVDIRFSDNGCGMPPEVQARIFDPFYSTKGEKGTGLGLSTVRRIIEKYQGSIRVESEPGNGTTFILWLPYDYSMPHPEAA